MAKKTQWKYNKSATVTLPDGSTENFATQLYQTGVYVIWNNNAASQGRMSPASMEKMCKKIQKDLDAGKLSSVEWSSVITVTEKEGLFVEVE